MNQKTVTKEAFNVIGIEIRTSNETAVTDIPKLWERFFAEDIKNRIPNKTDGNILAVYTNYEGNHTKPYSYILCCEVNALNNILSGMIGKTIPSAKYDVFTVTGKMPDKIVEMWGHIWNSEIEKRRAYVSDFEVYGKKYGDPDNSEMEIYIGVR